MGFELCKIDGVLVGFEVGTPPLPFIYQME